MTTHHRAARLMADECLCFRVRRTSRALTRLYDEALRPLGIQATQLTLLNAVALCDAGDGAEMARLADVLAMDPTTLSRNLRPLETAGHVRVTRRAADRRVRLARLTADGERLVAAALPRWQHAHAHVVGALGADSAAALRQQFDATVHATAALAPLPPLPPRP